MCSVQAISTGIQSTSLP